MGKLELAMAFGVRVVSDNYVLNISFVQLCFIGEDFLAKARQATENWFFFGKFLPLHSSASWQNSIATLVCVDLKSKGFSSFAIPFSYQQSLLCLSYLLLRSF